MPPTWAGHSAVFGRVSNSGIWRLVNNHEEGRMPAKRELTMRQIRYVLRLASEGVSTREIAQMLGVQRGVRRRAEPVWSELFRELKRPGVNLMVLWEEYRAGHPEGYGYSRYVAAVVMLRSVLSSRGNG
jgi:hypothetical protein